jgi:hypothetical protein|tara:strand:+ start:2192 stop:2455 length:264 start_codon:yes stop_codon:yes gene_type:complete
MGQKKFNFQALPGELTNVSSSGSVLIPTETSVSFSAPCTGDELETFLNEYMTHQIVTHWSKENGDSFTSGSFTIDILWDSIAADIKW